MTIPPDRRELFPLTAHAEAAKDFARHWNGYRSHLAGLTAARDAIPGHPDLMDFSGALLALKAGHHVARDTWRGRYVMLQVGYPTGIPLNANTAAATGLPEGTPVTFLPYLIQYVPNYGDVRAVIRTAVAKELQAPAFAPWTPDVVDLLADDWRAYPRPDDPAAVAAREVDITSIGRQTAIRAEEILDPRR